MTKDSGIGQYIILYIRVVGFLRFFYIFNKFNPVVYCIPVKSKDSDRFIVGPEMLGNSLLLGI
jgi:hypothetical protein